MTPLIQFLILVLAGTLASFINVMAGGGSLISISIMILMGIDPVIANASNRIGILSSTTSATTSFAKSGVLSIKRALKYALFAVPGSIAGALFTSKIDSDLFAKIFSVITILVALTLFIPKKNDGLDKHSKWLYPGLFFIGFYGGFIQAGVGIMIMALFRHAEKLALVKVNAYKVAITLIFTIPAIIVFILNDMILWVPAVAIAIGNWIGAKISVQVAVKKGDKVVTTILAVMLVVFSVRLLMEMR